jgi:tRNA A58 N-methylase Trm61
MDVAVLANYVAEEEAAAEAGSGSGAAAAALARVPPLLRLEARVPRQRWKAMVAFLLAKE